MPFHPDLDLTFQMGRAKSITVAVVYDSWHYTGMLDHEREFVKLKPFLKRERLR